MGPNYNLISGSINYSQDKLFLSFDLELHGVEDIYTSEKNNNVWGRLTNIGSSVNSGISRHISISFTKKIHWYLFQIETRKDMSYILQS